MLATCLRAWARPELDDSGGIDADTGALVTAEVINMIRRALTAPSSKGKA